MGKDQELLEAARTGNVALVEKLLSGRKGGILGGGSGPLPLSNLLSIWRGPNVNCTDSSGYTALHHAALNGHKDIVLKLLQYEASTNVADNKGYFPIHLAAWKGDVEIVKILIHHGPSHSRVNEQNNENETALHCAAQYGHSEVVAVLLEELTDPTIRNSKLETPLDLAALYGRLRVVKMIISAHPNLMSCNTRKHTPLHLAARNGHKAVVQVLLEAGMDVSCQTEKGSALHEAALFGKVDVVRVLLETGIDANIKDSLGRTVLDILKEHPSQKSLQIATLLQDYLEGAGRSAVLEEHAQEDTAQETHLSSPAESPQKTKSETVTGELSKLLDEIKLCQEKDYSFEDLCHTISDHYLDNLSKISEEELGKNGSQSVRTSSTINLSPGEVEDEEEDPNSCGPTGLWEALTPCNGCRNLGFPMLAQESYPKKRNYPMEIVPSASLDTFPSENENFLCELVDTAVTKKPCSLEIARAPSPRTDNASEVAITAPGTSHHRNSSTGPTPDCSPPSPDTALKNIVKVIRPQDQLEVGGSIFPLPMPPLNRQVVGPALTWSFPWDQLTCTPATRVGSALCKQDAEPALPSAAAVEGQDSHDPRASSPAYCSRQGVVGDEGFSLSDYLRFMIFQSTLECPVWELKLMETGDWGEPSITLRPPNEATASTPVQYWQHHPEKLIFQSCDYKAFYLGSMLIKELRGTESTQDACAKMRANCQKSTEQMKKVPTIILSVSYKGVKFIDAANKNIIAEHEIRNISCAAQDPEDLSTFAYITKDLKSNHHYCHVFTAFDVNLAYEIILTLGQAFEVAYQLALQARKGGHSSTLPESFENKPSKPIPKPRVSIRKSVIDPSEQKTLANLPWIVEPGQEAKRGINTKYETTIF
ncbi:ankyrin repeat and sterile alpha motif domain-containing protein 1B [Grammomys surdaster]|uniref:ankyrin repeat and sterile alpha motif domain-containing protein 1B n=1 Tax=Grammomys surdaster TaxID=491861 RepID=UPI00109FB0F1|nr:ankyrin repeat and sterile alpha motif domain-containing protein 1B [Grammomys surdaster]